MYSMDDTYSVGIQIRTIIILHYDDCCGLGVIPDHLFSGVDGCWEGHEDESVTLEHFIVPNRQLKRCGVLSRFKRHHKELL